MSDLISRNALCEFCLNTKDRMIDANDIMRFPSAEPERKKGEWIIHENYDECSKCHCFTSVGFNFCPHCGADMREEYEDAG